MPGITNPPLPRPKKIAFTDGTFSWISCSDDLKKDTLIFDWNTTYGYLPTPSGTYHTATETVVVVNGVVQ